MPKVARRRLVAASALPAPPAEARNARRCSFVRSIVITRATSRKQRAPDLKSPNLRRSAALPTGRYRISMSSHLQSMPAAMRGPAPARQCGAKLAGAEVIATFRRHPCRRCKKRRRYQFCARAESPRRIYRYAPTHFPKVAGVCRAQGEPAEGPLRVCAVKRRRFSVGTRPTRQPLQPEAAGAAMEVTK